MKVYFACSIRGGRDDQALYAELIKVIQKKATVLSEFFGQKKLFENPHEKQTDQEIYQIDLQRISESDVVIAEVTNPSLGVGYEIARAEEWRKPVLALFRPSSGRSLSAMIAGSPSTKTVHYETVKEAEVAIKLFLGTHK